MHTISVEDLVSPKVTPAGEEGAEGSIVLSRGGLTEKGAK